MSSKTTPYRWALLLMLLFVGALACGGLSQVAESAEKLEQAAQTAQAIATHGGELATQIGESGVVQTGEALVTDAAESGIAETLQAAVAEIPGQSADAKATMDVVLTEGAYGEAPPNIPLVDAEMENFFGSPGLITYSVNVPFDQVLAFYRREMPEYGWDSANRGNILRPDFAKLFYQNPYQRAEVTINKDTPTGDTLVMINIYEQ